MESTRGGWGKASGFVKFVIIYYSATIIFGVCPRPYDTVKKYNKMGMSERKEALKHLDSLISILKSEDADISVDDVKNKYQPKDSLVKPLSMLERKKAFEQLRSLISKFCFAPNHSDELSAIQLEDLPNMFLLLAELAAEARASEKNRKEKKKLLHLATLLLGHLLQMPNASHYRVLGLNDGATLVQIEKHYQLFCKLFWFDGDFDPQRKSRSRISTAYAVLKNPELRHQYNNQLQQQSLFATPRRKVRKKNDRWSFAAVAMLMVLGVAGAMFYFDKTMETDVTSSSQKSMLKQPEKTPATEKVVSEIPALLQTEQQLQTGVAELDVQTVVPKPEQAEHLPVSDQQEISMAVIQDNDIAPISVVSEEPARQEAVPSMIPARDNVVVDLPPKVESLPLTSSRSKSEAEQTALLAESVLIESHGEEDALPRGESLKDQIEQAALPAASASENFSAVGVLPPLEGASLKDQIERTDLPAATSVRDNPVVSVPPESESPLSLKDRIEKTTLPSF